ncbi:MAG: hypothetical protein KDE27_25375, partial [Planctomycetes bacterium]|nr:hypothetical protein [Planctomycetota bacterium]
MRTSARLGFLLGLFVVLFGGAVAGWFVGGVVPAAIRDGRIELRSEPYVGAWGSAPFEIDDARRLPIPFTFADFDMQLEVELGEGAIVDLVVRRVEPRVIGSEIVPFHGRFSVLRLSADRAGPPWLSRTEALLGDRGAGGVDLAPGHTATVWLRGRGRWLEANVAGRRLPRFLAEDEFGSFLVVARGGRAVVRSVAITPVPRAAPWLATRGGWVGLGLLLGALAAAVL